MFDVIGSALGVSASSAFGGIAGLGGGILTNMANSAQAEKQMAFQERMASTQYQRAVKDMKLAGINPILAYKQGGAHAPSGTMAQMTNPVTPALDMADQISNSAQSRKVNKEVATKAWAEAQLLNAKRHTEEEQANFLSKQAGLAEVNKQKAQQEANGAQMINEVRGAYLQAAKTKGGIKSSNAGLQWLDVIMESLGQVLGGGNSAKSLFKGN